MNSKFQKSLLAIATIGMLSSCGSIKTKEKNLSEIQTIKKIAIVAFDQDQPAPREIGLDLGSGKLAGSEGGSMITQHTENAKRAYQTLAAQLNRAGFAVMSLEEMLKNKGYQEAYKSTMEGWQNKMPPGAGMNRVAVEKVMDYDGPRILRQEGRDQLAKQLGVDAIVSAKIYVNLESTTVMGIGNRFQKSTVRIEMFKPNIENAVWFENFMGPTSTESVGKTSFFDEAKMSQLSLESASDAISRISKTAE